MKIKDYENIKPKIARAVKEFYSKAFNMPKDFLEEDYNNYDISAILLARFTQRFFDKFYLCEAYYYPIEEQIHWEVNGKLVALGNMGVYEFIKWISTQSPSQEIQKYLVDYVKDAALWDEI